MKKFLFQMRMRTDCVSIEIPDEIFETFVKKAIVKPVDSEKRFDTLPTGLIFYDEASNIDPKIFDRL